MKRKAFKYRLKTNDGFPAKIVVKFFDYGKENAIVIKKTSFSPYKWEGAKRKWKELFYSEELLVLKFNTFLNIANELQKFINENKEV